MSPVAIQGVDDQSVYVQGVQAKKTLNAANSTVAKGVYDATTLEAVDADLTAAKIALNEVIFGKTGTYNPAPTETIEKYADATLAGSATYTPAASGIFFSQDAQVGLLSIKYYSTAAAAWYRPRAYTAFYGCTAIGDGTNFQIENISGGDVEYCLMRHYLSTGTYERARDEQLANNATWTPANSGFFASGGEASPITLQVNKTTAGWTATGESAQTRSVTVVIGDGTNLRVQNAAGGVAYYHVAMRAKLTA